MGDEEKRSPDLEGLQADKLRSEIEKNKAEEEKARQEAAYFEKQVNDVWYSGRSLKVFISSLIAALTLGSLFYAVVIRPITTKKDELAALNTLLAQAKLDSLNTDVRNIKRERDEIDSLRVLLLTDKTLLLSRNDSLTAIIQKNIESTRNLQSKFANLSAEYTKQSKVQDITTAEKRRLENLASQATAENDDLKEQVTRLTAEKAGVERASRQIRKIASPNLSEAQVGALLAAKGLYDRDYNPKGTGIKHGYETQTINGDKIVVDEATGLTWQHGGSQKLSFGKANDYVSKINSEGYAGFNDWRLPTLEEAMSLMEPEQKSGDLYIAPDFDQTQRLIWTSDKFAASSAWVVHFISGYCIDYHVSNHYYVRAVR